MSYKNNTTDPSGNNGFLPTVIFAGTGTLTVYMRIAQLKAEGITGYYEADFADGITTIGNSCFYNDTKLVVASINKVSTIGTSAFNSCTNLRAITLDTATASSTGIYLLNSIGDGAFNKCTSLRNVYIPDSIKGTIGAYWFQGCTALEVCVIGNGFDEIILQAYMFDGCTSLKYIVIPENVKTIGSYAFQNCTSLTYVAFNGMPTLESDTFNGAKGTGATYTYDTSWNSTYVGYLPSNRTSKIYRTIDMPHVEELTPDDVKLRYIANFGEVNQYYKAVISGSTTKIAKYAFRANEAGHPQSWALVCIKIPNTVTTIGAAAFSTWYGTGWFQSELKGIYIPRSVTRFNLENATDSQLFNVNNDGARQIGSCLQIVFPSGTNGTSGFSSYTSTNESINNTFGTTAFYYCAAYAIILPPTTKILYKFALAQCIYLRLCNLFQKNAKSNLENINESGCYGLGYAVPNKYIYLPRSLGLLGLNSLTATEATNMYMYSHVDGSFSSGNNLWAYLLQSNYFSGTLYVIASYHPNGGVGLPNGGVGLTGQPVYSGSHMLHVKEVNTISANAFLNCGNYKTMAFDHYGGPNLIIGSNAFEGASNIEHVYLNDRLLDIVGEETFKGCSSLTSMILPDRLTSIPKYTFQGCSKLSYVSIGPNSSIKKMDNHCFLSCLLLTNIHIPTATISIGTNAFTPSNLDTGLETITFGGGSRLSSICALAFGSGASGFGSTKLTKLILPNNVSWIDINVFRNTRASYDVFIIPSKTDYIPHAMFYQEGYPYYAITNLYFPVSITADPGPRKRSNYYDNGMDTYCFPAPQSECTAYMPSHMSSLFNNTPGEYRFNSVTINGDKSVPYTASYYKTEVVASGGRISLNTSASVANITDPVNTTQRHIEFDDSPDTISGVSDGNKSNLISVNIPRSATSIGGNAFNSCSKLVYVNFEEGSKLTTIYNDAFNGCSMLHEITLPSSLTSIGSYAFKDCSRMERIEIPYNVYTIGAYAFYGCTNLKHVTVYRSEFAATSTYFNSDTTFLVAATLSLTNTLHPTKLTISQINNLYIYKRQTQLGIPTITFSANGQLTQSAVNTQLAAASVYTNDVFHVEFSEDVTSISDGAFSYARIFSVAISKNITYIGEIAFPGIFYLSFHPDSQCTTIGTRAFSSNFLFDLALPDSLTTISDNAFSFSRNLTSVCIPSNVETIGLDAFSWNLALTNVRVPSSLSVYVGGSYFSQTRTTDLSPSPTVYTTPSVPHFKLTDKSMPIGIVKNLFDPSLNYIDHLAYAYYPEISVYAEPRNQMKFAGPFNYQINGTKMPCVPAAFLQHKTGAYDSDFPIYRSIPDYVYLTADSTYGALDNVDDQYLIMPGYSVTVYNNLYEEGNILANQYIAGESTADSHYKVADRADRFQHFDNEYGKKPAQIAMTNPKTGSSILVMHSGKMVSKIYI